MINNDHIVRCSDYLCIVSRNIPPGGCGSLYYYNSNASVAYVSRLVAWTKGNKGFQYITLTSMRVKRCPD